MSISVKLNKKRCTKHFIENPIQNIHIDIKSLLHNSMSYVTKGRFQNKTALGFFLLQNNNVSGRMVNKTNYLGQLFSFVKFVSKMYTGFLLPLVVFGSLFQKAVLHCCIPSQLQTNIDVYLPVGNRTFQTVVSIFFYLSTIYSCLSVFIYICFELFAGH